MLRYIEEALEEVPLNKNLPCKTLPTQGVEKETQEKKTKIQTERKVQEKLVIPEGAGQFWAISSVRGKSTGHQVRQGSWDLGLDSWATWCGWRFAQKHVKVKLSLKLGQHTQECKECKAIRGMRDDVKEGVSLAQLVTLKVPPGQQHLEDLRKEGKPPVKAGWGIFKGCQSTETATSTNQAKIACLYGGWVGQL